MMPEGRKLERRGALVTGAAGGIGAGIARLFAEHGARVACVDIDGAGAESLAAAIRAAGGAATAVVADVATDAGARNAVETAEAELGGIDILVTTAVHFPPELPITGIAPAEFDRALAVNVGGVFHISRHVLPGMVRRRRGVVIHLASQLGSVGKPGQALYCATKGAVVAFCRALALDHAADGIRVVSLSPGGVATAGMAAKWGDMETAEREWGRPMHPLGRLARVGEVARAALFLASDDASFVTGTDLLVDGGYTAR